LRDAVDSKDGKKVATEAHIMKGMLSNLAASSAAGAAARLEQLGRNQEVSEFQAACASFENLSKELLPVEELLQEPMALCMPLKLPDATA
jgi:HPt (histidine-containing phosphotransfer) domain-containing protein